MPENEHSLNRLILHPSFKDTVEEVNRIKIHLPSVVQGYQMYFEDSIFPTNGKLLTPMEEISQVNLDAKEGERLFKTDRPLLAYDESLNKFSCLEGAAYFASHSVVYAADDDFIPTNMLTFYFYTRSKGITDKSERIRHSKDPDADSKKDFVRDKMQFLADSLPEKSLVLIDGPLIGGEVSSYVIRGVKGFANKGVIPVFFVKNSSSNLVTNNIAGLKGKFNSDLHWAYGTLKPGQRTNFFKYVDRRNPKNAKVFCYLKAFDLSPQRVEFHVDTYSKHKPLIPGIMDLVYYLILVQGDYRNPQARPIAVAEKYARATLKLLSFNELMKRSGVIPTMNQERFGW